MNDLSQLAGAVALLVALAAFVLNIIMALAVMGDAKRLRASGGGLFLFEPIVWGWITFAFSLAGFALYWAIHHSSLRSTASQRSDGPDR